jgi:hypothetical protein
LVDRNIPWSYAMCRLLVLVLLGWSLFVDGGGAVRADDTPTPPQPRVSLAGSIDDEALEREAPATGVIATPAAWEKLVKAWGIKDAPKIDFATELIVVGTWKGSSFNLTPQVTSGDLTVVARGTKDLLPGFRWKVVSVPRTGIKTINGKPLPRE